MLNSFFVNLENVYFQNIYIQHKVDIVDNYPIQINVKILQTPSRDKQAHILQIKK